MSSRSTQTPSRWPHRLAVATLVAAVPLLAFGGQVTTLQAGLAIDGWWVLEPGRGDHILWLYPTTKWFRDPGTFVEHTHRLFGTLVGLLSIATVVATFRADGRRVARMLAVLGLVAVCVQGTIGGFRVLEKSPELAFLHGVLGQGVFAALAAVAVVLSPRWQRQGRAACKVAPGLHRVSIGAGVVVYLAIALGAYFRHAQTGAGLVLHLVAVFAAVGLLLVLGRRLRLGAEAGRPGEVDREVLRGVGRRLHALLGLQVLLGVGAFVVVVLVARDRVERIHESLLPTLHVVFGALLLAQTVAAAMWSRRVLATREADSREPLREGAMGVTS